MSRSSASKGKAVWTRAIHKIFVESCLEQTLKGNRPSTHFTKEGWKNIGDSLYKRTGLQYDKKQIKNHWVFTKEQWKIWCKLISCSSMKWDPETNTFGAGDEDWTEYIQVHPEAAQFRFKELQQPDKLEIICDFMTNSEERETPGQHKRLSDSSTTSLLHTKDPGVDILYDKNKNIESAAMVQSKCGRKIASQHRICSSSGKRRKATWTANFHKIFVDLCVEEVLKGNWDITKEIWKIWYKLVGTRCMKWDPHTNEFGASEEDWGNYVEANPEAAQFRYKKLQSTDKLAIMFDGLINNGETESPMQFRRHSDDSSSSFLHMEEPIFAKPERMVEPLSDAVESWPLTVQSKQCKLTYSIGECINCLDGMEEIEQGSDLYLFALDVFLKKEYREIFLHLKTPRVRIAWLQRLQTSALPLQVA